ncbi:MAG: SDR family NAD(P)-dependent oxidoreductase [Acidimicrobiales bacterium]
MSKSLVWVSGASSGIGRAMVDKVPWEGARVIGISRRPGPAPAEHLRADLSDPASWQAVGESFAAELDGFDGERVVFVHAAGTVDPIGFAGRVDSEAYSAGVVLNSAAPQVLGHMFLAAARPLEGRQPRPGRHLVMITSGAAKGVYAGWSSYGAGKAAMDQWVRNAGAEQALGGGVQVLAVAPGTVDTAMQARLRETPEGDFPARAKFVGIHESGGLSDPHEVATRIWGLLDGDLPSGSVLDLRDRP